MLKHDILHPVIQLTYTGLTCDTPFSVKTVSDVKDHCTVPF